jgi:hypothetical protein
MRYVFSRMKYEELSMYAFIRKSPAMRGREILKRGGVRVTEDRQGLSPFSRM